VEVAPARPTHFALRIRIPGWAQGDPVPGPLYRYANDESSETPRLAVNGEPISLTIEDGYAVIDRTWQQGDRVEVLLPMPVRRVISHPKVVTNQGMVAVERGPLVYCLEGIDNDGKALGRSLSDSAQFSVEWQPDLLQGVNLIRARQGGEDLTFVPYYAWAHRGVGEMAVWLKRSE
jgi:uncharacterized protein